MDQRAIRELRTADLELTVFHKARRGRARSGCRELLTFFQARCQRWNIRLELLRKQSNRWIGFGLSFKSVTEPRVALAAEKARGELPTERLWDDVLKGELSRFEANNAPTTGPGNFDGEPQCCL